MAENQSKQKTTFQNIEDFFSKNLLNIVLIFILILILFDIGTQYYLCYKVTHKVNLNNLFNALMQTVSIPILLTIYGIISFTEKIFAIRSEKLQRIYKYALLICGIFIFSLLCFCSTAYSTNVSEEKDLEKTKIFDFKLNNQSFYINIDYAFQLDDIEGIDSEKFKELKNDFLDLKNNFHMLSRSKVKNLFKTTRDIGDKAFKFIKIREKDPDSYFQEFILKAKKPEEKAKLKIFDIICRIILLDTYIQNIDELSQYKGTEIKIKDFLKTIQKKLKTYINEHESDLLRILNENTKYKLDDLLFFGTLENLEGIVNAFYYSPQPNEAEIDHQIVNQLNAILDSLNTTYDQKNKLLKYCNLALDTLVHWIEEDSLIFANQQTYREVSLKDDFDYSLWLSDSISLNITLGDASPFLDDLRFRIAEYYSELEAILDTLYLPFYTKCNIKIDSIINALNCDKQYHISDSILLSLFNEAKSINGTEIELNNFEFMIGKLDSLSESMLLKQTYFDTCRTIFDNSYECFDKTRGFYKDYKDTTYFTDLRFMPRLNLISLGLNWDIEEVKSILDDMKMPDLPYYHEIKKNIENIYYKKQARGMQELISRIENTRLYFESGTSQLIRSSENKLRSLTLDIRRLIDLSKSLNEQLIVFVCGHNGLSEEKARQFFPYHSESFIHQKFPFARLALRRSNVILEKFGELGFSNYCNAHSLNEFDKEVGDYFSNGVLSDNLIKVLDDVKLFEMLEQSVTFKVINKDDLTSLK